jgi:hypothetical protein
MPDTDSSVSINILRQNGSNAIISDGTKTFREETSQRFGMTTKMAISNTIAMERYIRWQYAGVPQSRGARDGGGKFSTMLIMSKMSKPIIIQAAPTASIVAKVLQTIANGSKRDCIGYSMPNEKS